MATHVLMGEQGACERANHEGTKRSRQCVHPSHVQWNGWGARVHVRRANAMRLGDGLSALVCIKRSIQLRNCSARRTANRTMSGGRADVAIAHPTMEWKRISPRFTRPHSCLPVALARPDGGFSRSFLASSTARHATVRAVSKYAASSPAARRDSSAQCHTHKAPGGNPIEFTTKV
jgi:hypothetical protein